MTEEGRLATVPSTGLATASRPVSRRALLGLSVGVPMACALAACSPQDTSTSPRPGLKVQLVYQDWRTEWFPKMAQEMLGQFHATHPNIRVFYLPDPENLEERMPEAMQAGTAPDVFQGCCAHFPAWVQKGYVLDLAPFAKADLDPATVADWDPAQYRSFFTRDGKQYGLPKYHGALALYFNKDLFENAKLDFPTEGWTYTDYLEAMKRLTRDRDGDGRVDQWGSMVDISWDRLQMYANDWGGHFVDPVDGVTCRMADEPTPCTLR